MEISGDDQRLASAGRSGRRLKGAVGRELGCLIASGRYRPGQAFLNEADFARQLNVSRSHYREVIRYLAGKGLVEARPQSGIRVLERGRWNLLDPEVMSWATSGPVNGKLLSDFFELRLTIEPAAAKMAALRRTEAESCHITGLTAAITSPDFCWSEDVGMLADLHSAIMTASQNGFLASMTEGVAAATKWCNSIPGTSRVKCSLRAYEDLSSCIGLGDGDRAYSAMCDVLGLEMSQISFMQN